MVFETVVMAQGIDLGGTVEVVDHVEAVGQLLVETEVGLVEVVEFQSSYLAVNSVLTSIVP